MRPDGNYRRLHATKLIRRDVDDFTYTETYMLHYDIESIQKYNLEFPNAKIEFLGLSYSDTSYGYFDITISGTKEEITPYYNNGFFPEKTTKITPFLNNSAQIQHK